MWLPGAVGWGRGEVRGERVWEAGLADAYYYIRNGQTTRSYFIARDLYSISYDKP